MQHYLFDNPSCAWSGCRWFCDPYIFHNVDTEYKSGGSLTNEGVQLAIMKMEIENHSTDNITNELIKYGGLHVKKITNLFP